MKSKVYYSVQNCGDGSAYPTFFEDELCAEIDQELMEEGWGESCTGCLEVESKSKVKFLDITTRKEFIKELEEKLEDGEDESISDAIERLKN